MTKQFDLFAGADAMESEKSHDSQQMYSSEPINTGSKSVSRQITLSEFYDGHLLYIPDWLKTPLADRLFTELRSTLAWQQDSIKLYGKWVTIPRLQAWYGDPQARYQYSGIEMQPQVWTEALSDLKSRCETTTECAFNSVLANLYRDGADSMGMHCDNEPELGTHPTIASITLGYPRRFDFKHKRDKTRLQINLGHGSLLIMKEATQQHWQHGIQKTKKTVGERINLTFRNIIVG